MEATEGRRINQRLTGSCTRGTPSKLQPADPCDKDKPSPNAATEAESEIAPTLNDHSYESISKVWEGVMEMDT